MARIISGFVEDANGVFHNKLSIFNIYVKQAEDSKYYIIFAKYNDTFIGRDSFNSKEEAETQMIIILKELSASN